MGFAQTADYFHRRANQAREPAGYKGWTRTSRATRYEARAEECRTIAARLSDPKCREQMLSLADMYVGMATAAE